MSSCTIPQPPSLPPTHPPLPKLSPHLLPAFTTTTTTSTPRSPFSIVKKKSYEEKRNRKKKGLCYNYEEKFTLGHKYKTQFLFQLELLEDVEEPVIEEPEGPEDSEDSAVHVYKAPCRCEQLATAQIHKCSLVVLFDSGSVTISWTQRWHSELVYPPWPPPIHGRDGRQRHHNKGLRVSLAMPMLMQELTIPTDFYLLPLAGCEAALGVQWLQQLGPITWAFTSMKLEFNSKGLLVTIVGESF